MRGDVLVGNVELLLLHAVTAASAEGERSKAEQDIEVVLANVVVEFIEKWSPTGRSWRCHRP